MICYTDGSCQGNPGPGGFGVVVLDDNENFITYHAERFDDTTNNRMELSAILWAFLKYGGPAAAGQKPLIVYSDSAYCVNVLTNWMFSWEKRGWLKADNKSPENLDLIIPFFKHLQNGNQIEIHKVKGHNNILWNEIADRLAIGEREIKINGKIYFRKN